MSIDARGDGVRLHLTPGRRLPDPERIPHGSGQSLFVEVEAARRLAEPGVEALIRAAIALAAIPLPSAGKGRLVVRPTAARARAARNPAR